MGPTDFFSFPSSQLWVEHLEGAEAGDPRGDGAGEGVALEVEACERGEGEEVGGEGAGEAVGAEAEQLQRIEAGERARRDGAGEAEAREVQRDDAGFVGAAGDPGPAGAGGAGERGGGPVDARAGGGAAAHPGEEGQQRRLVSVGLGGREAEAARPLLLREEEAQAPAGCRGEGRAAAPAAGRPWHRRRR